MKRSNWEFVRVSNVALPTMFKMFLHTHYLFFFFFFFAVHFCRFVLLCSLFEVCASCNFMLSKCKHRYEFNLV